MIQNFIKAHITKSYETTGSLKRLTDGRDDLIFCRFPMNYERKKSAAEDFNKKNISDIKDIRYAICATSKRTLDIVTNLKNMSFDQIIEASTKEIISLFSSNEKSQNFHQNKGIAFNLKWTLFHPDHLNDFGFNLKDIIATEYWRQEYDRGLDEGGRFYDLEKPYKPGEISTSLDEEIILSKEFQKIAQRVIDGSLIEQVLANDKVVCTFTLEKDGDAIKRMIALARDKRRDLTEIVATLENLMRGPI